MNKTSKVTLLATFTLLAIYSLYGSIYKPDHNWDMLMYIAAAKSFEEPNIPSLQSFSYLELKQTVSEQRFQNIVNGGPYRKAVSTDPTAFREQLPFYQIRPAYNGLIYLFYKCGISIGSATYLISGLSVTIAIALLYLLSASLLPMPLAHSVPAFALLFGVPKLAQLSTPDGMAFLILVTSAYFLLKQQIRLLLILLPLAICIRTDLILYTMPLMLLTLITHNHLKWHTMLTILASIVIYLFIGAYWGNPGWSTIFYFTGIEHLTHPLSQPPTLTVQQYFDVFGRQFSLELQNKALILFCIMSGYFVYFLKKNIEYNELKYTLSSPNNILFIVCISFIFVHFIAFPVAWDRFFAAPYMIGTFAFLTLIKNKFSKATFI